MFIKEWVFIEDVKNHGIIWDHVMVLKNSEHLSSIEASILLEVDASKLDIPDDHYGKIPGSIDGNWAFYITYAQDFVKLKLLS